MSSVSKALTVVGLAVAVEVVKPGTVTVRNISRVAMWMAAAVAALVVLWVVLAVVVALTPAPVSTPNCAATVATAAPSNPLCGSEMSR